MPIEWFDYDNDITLEMKEALKSDLEIDSEEAKFISEVIDLHKWRENIIIEKSKLLELWRKFWFNYSKISRIWPALEKAIRTRAGIISNAKNSIKNDFLVLSTFTGDEDGNTEVYNENKYISIDWKLRNVTKITLKTLVSRCSELIDNIVWDKYNFSITNKKWVTSNVYLWFSWISLNIIKDYFYTDWPKKDKKVRIYNWDTLWPYKNTGNSSGSLEWYNTIYNPVELRKMFLKGALTKENINLWLEVWLKTRRLRVWGRRNKISVKELAKLYKEYIDKTVDLP
jgi:hypothetical protein